jgi:hypothetical protein
VTWKEHVHPDLRYITVHRHKTAATLWGPQVAPISDQLRLILNARQRTDTYTISLDDLRSWLANASYHVRLSCALLRQRH